MASSSWLFAGVMFITPVITFFVGAGLLVFLKLMFKAPKVGHKE